MSRTAFPSDVVTRINPDADASPVPVPRTQRRTVAPARTRTFARELSANGNSALFESSTDPDVGLNNPFGDEGRGSVPQQSIAAHAVEASRLQLSPRLNQVAPSPSKGNLPQMHRSVTTIDIAEASESSSSGASKHSRPRPAVSQFRHLFTFGRNPLCRGDFLYHPLSGTMPYTVLAEYRWRMFIFEFVDVILRGLGQVIFINNPLTGLFILVAAVLNCQYCALVGMIGIVASTLTAYAFHLPRGAIQAGIFGYNGYLVGTAYVLFQADLGGEDNYYLIIPGIICACLSTFVSYGLSNILSNIAGKPSGVFTFPFHVMTWIWLLGSHGYAYYPNQRLPALQDISTVGDRTLVEYDFERSVRSVFVSVGQVCFFNTFTSGMLVTVGVLLASRISGIAAIVGAAVGVYGAIALGADPGEIYEGLWGYDSTLACICVGGLFFRLSPRTAVLAVIAAMFATLSHGAWRSFFYPVGLPPLTFGAATTCFLFTSMGKILPRVYVMPLGDVKLPEENF